MIEMLEVLAFIILLFNLENNPGFSNALLFTRYTAP
jgi:hypothetical protein